jgi:MFS family permease
LWAAAVVSYTGTWLQHTAAGWLMTSFTSSPAMVALVTAASSQPVLLSILPAGAVADVCDRRRLLLVTQSWMAVMAAVLGVLTLSHAVTPLILLLLTFLLGLGAAINDPAWQAITSGSWPLNSWPRRWP